VLRQVCLNARHRLLQQRSPARAGRLLNLERFVAGGMTLAEAAAAAGISPATVHRDRQRVAGLREVDWAPALAVAARGHSEPPWATALLKVWRTPTKRGLADVVDQLRAELPAGAATPSCSQARRYLAGLSSVERARGRLGPNALKGVRAFVRRTVDGLEPGDCYTPQMATPLIRKLCIRRAASHAVRR
jgi:hypothetical protein